MGEVEFYAEMNAWILTNNDAQLSAKKFMDLADACFRISTLGKDDEVTKRLLEFFVQRAFAAKQRCSMIQDSAAFVEGNPVFPNKDINAYIVAILMEEVKQEHLKEIAIYREKVQTANRICAYLNRFHIPYAQNLGLVVFVDNFGVVDYGKSFWGMAMHVGGAILLRDHALPK